jgi:hypothetical protein
MKNKQYAVGFRSDVLGLAVGKIGETPVGILTLRLNPKENFQPLSIMLDRPALERLVEDLNKVLRESKMLAAGGHQEVTLLEVENIHNNQPDCV